MTQHCGIIAIIGKPNAGKSTLLNRLLGQKLAIVSPKVQTTRNCLKGIITRDNAQAIFIDTPGIFEAQKAFERSLVKAAWSGLAQADILLVIVDAARKLVEEDPLLQKISHIEKPSILVLNKIDRIEPSKLLSLSQTLNERYPFQQTFMISAKTGDGVEDLLKYLLTSLPAAPFAFTEDEISDAPMKFLAAEFTREQLFLRLDQELPYSVAVETESWKETPKSITIHQAIYVLRESHKKMIIGNKGEGIKTIGERSRREITHLTGKKVSLFLFVKVEKDWQSKLITAY